MAAPNEEKLCFAGVAKRPAEALAAS